LHRGEIGNAVQTRSGDPADVNAHRLDEGIQFWAKLAATPSSAAQRPLFALLSEFLGRLQETLHFDHCAFSFYDPTRPVVAVVFESGKFRFPQEVPVNQNSLGLVLQHQQAIEVDDIRSDTRFPDLNAIAEDAGFRCFRVVPLSTLARRLGTLGVARRQPGSFSVDETRTLDHAAELVALVLENGFMTEVLAGEKKRLETLLDITTALISSLDVHKLFQEVASLLQPFVRQDFTHLALYDAASGAMKHHILDSTAGPLSEMRESTVPVGECPTGIAFTRGERMQFAQPELQLIGSSFSQDLLTAGVQSISCFPLISRGRKLGALGLASTQNGHYSQGDLVLLTQIAAQVAIAVDNARAHEEIGLLKDRLSKEKLYLEEEIRSQHNFGEVVGNSPALRQVLKQVEIAAPSDATVLILGETGTGKELIARALHRLSARHENNFIKLNCAAIPTGLLESELFGHEKGAFTGAISQKIGRLELADKGTVFLDEIGEISLELQPKLLRALQDHEFERLGGVRTIKVNVRVIAATNRDLATAVTDHQFRRDLYYRLNVFPIRLPALHERPGDIPLLVRYFVQKFARRMGKTIESIPAELVQQLERWHWPGNIRELENFLERSVILTQGKVLYAPLAELRMVPDQNRNFGTLEEIEREYIVRMLREAGGIIAGVRGAAARLGMKRTTLQSRMQKLGITRDHYQQ
jgi:formate hydrogenlyase transcriptional activator